MNKSLALIGLASFSIATTGVACIEPQTEPTTTPTTNPQTTPAGTQPATPNTTDKKNANNAPGALRAKPNTTSAAGVKPENVPQTAEGQNWQNNLTLTDNHTALKSFVGAWTCEIALFSAGSPSTKSFGTMVNTPLFGGRYITTAFAGDMLGQNFQGTGTWGFNTVSNRFESAWIDSMSTGIAFETGSFDSSSRTFTMTGNFDDTQTGNKKTQKTTYTFETNDKYTITTFEVAPDGAQQKVMTIACTRGTAESVKKSSNANKLNSTKQSKNETAAAGTDDTK